MTWTWGEAIRTCKLVNAQVMRYSKQSCMPFSISFRPIPSLFRLDFSGTKIHFITLKKIGEETNRGNVRIRQKGRLLSCPRFFRKGGGQKRKKLLLNIIINFSEILWRKEGGSKKVPFPPVNMYGRLVPFSLKRNVLAAILARWCYKIIGGRREKTILTAQFRIFSLKKL